MACIAATSVLSQSRENDNIPRVEFYYDCVFVQAATILELSDSRSEGETQPYTYAAEPLAPRIIPSDHAACDPSLGIALPRSTWENTSKL